VRVRAIRATLVLVLCSDVDLRQSLSELMAIGGVMASSELNTGDAEPALVIAACDALPPGWSLAALRARFRRVPCLLLSGSPLAGDFAVRRFDRGYFVQLPAPPRDILELATHLAGG
jgi:hypothetical protein